MIEKAAGPECPKCGCEHSQVLRRHSRWRPGSVSEQRRCVHCGHRFTERAKAAVNGEAEVNGADDDDDDANDPTEVGVTYTLCRCPKCHSHRVKAIKTIRSVPPVVHKRRCDDCQTIFRSSAQ